MTRTPENLQLCVSTRTGVCPHGVHCKFPHSVQEQERVREQKKLQKVCQYFLNGYCKYGNNCFYLHPVCQEKEKPKEKTPKVVPNLDEFPALSSQPQSQPQTPRKKMQRVSCIRTLEAHVKENVEKKQKPQGKHQGEIEQERQRAFEKAQALAQEQVKEAKERFRNEDQTFVLVTINAFLSICNKLYEIDGRLKIMEESPCKCPHAAKELYDLRRELEIVKNVLYEKMVKPQKN